MPIYDAAPHALQDNLNQRDLGDAEPDAGAGEGLGTGEADVEAEGDQEQHEGQYTKVYHPQIDGV